VIEIADAFGDDLFDLVWSYAAKARVFIHIAVEGGAAIVINHEVLQAQNSGVEARNT